jgi:hypothetical protein
LILKCFDDGKTDKSQRADQEQRFGVGMGDDEKVKLEGQEPHLAGEIMRAWAGTTS